MHGGRLPRGILPLEMHTSAKCSRLVPYRCMCRRAISAAAWPGPSNPSLAVNGADGDAMPRLASP